ADASAGHAGSVGAADSSVGAVPAVSAAAAGVAAVSGHHADAGGRVGLRTGRARTFHDEDAVVGARVVDRPSRTRHRRSLAHDHARAAGVGIRRRARRARCRPRLDTDQRGAPGLRDRTRRTGRRRRRRGRRRADRAVGVDLGLGQHDVGRRWTARALQHLDVQCSTHQRL
ncbi:MAG: hypothetical protein AVDCRST_MAG53-2522, partial [uncultured Solirubrobacteraceae bacterium]